MTSKWGEVYAHKSDAFSNTDVWKRDAEEVFAHLALLGYKNACVVDLACNTGRFIELAREVGFSLDYAGVDTNRHGLQIAHERLPDVPFLESLTELKRESVDHVVCMHALPQFENPEQVLSEVWIVLKRGGRISFVLHNRLKKYLWWLPNLFNGYKSDPTITREYSLAEVRQIMRDAGFLEEKAYLYGKSKYMPKWASPRLIFNGRKA